MSMKANDNIDFTIPWAKAGRTPRIAIIGAGMSGIAAVVLLREAGYTDVTVYEKADRPGGTWRENTYPGLSCDVPSHWYSFRFAPNPDWTHRYSYGPEIQAYMEKTAKDFGVTDVTRFNTPIESVTYEGPHWRLKTKNGEETLYDVVIAATGVLHHPIMPKIDGIEDFEGPYFHSARWDHSHPYEGKRVGVIGSGSTGAQIMGAIGPKVKKLVSFQRTPQWMVELPQKEYSRFYRWILRKFPSLTKLPRNYFRLMMGLAFIPATMGDKKAQQKIADAAMENLENNISDPELRKKLTPDFQAACKRLIFCSDFYPAISADNAELVTDGIERIEAKGVRTVDGRLHELDMLVYATGFDAAAFVLPMHVYGEDKRELGDVWAGAPRAHRAVAMPGFPNFWMLEGPTGPIGNFSLIMLSEWQVDHIVSALNKMRDEGLAAIAARQEAFEAYNAAMSRDIKNTIWYTGGCTSWYFDKSGNPNLYPWSPSQYGEEMQNPDYSEYRLIREIETQPPVAAE